MCALSVRSLSHQPHENMGYSMRFFGQESIASRLALAFGTISSLLAIAGTPASGQQAPFILPYTMSTFAGPHAQYTVGQACANGIGIALDISGNGCFATSVSIGNDPHDIRVDPRGFVYWQDNSTVTSYGVTHRISPYNSVETMYVGTLTTSNKVCSAGNTYGDGCVANDGAANAVSGYTKFNKLPRGLGMAPDGDLLIADYSGNYLHRVAFSTQLMSVVFGTGTASYIDDIFSKSTVSSARGVTQDAFGNVYAADTGNNAVRVAYTGFGTIPPVLYQGTGSPVASPVAGNVYSLTLANPTASVVHDYSTAVPAYQVKLQGVEDVQIDPNGNVIIDDTGNSLIRAIYLGKGNLPGITSPKFGYIYTIVGCNVANCTAVPYPKDGTTPTILGSTVNVGARKFSIDSRGNYYLAGQSDNVIWFVDGVTGYMRPIAGLYGGTAGADPGCAGETNAVGDGCPATKAAIYTSVASNTGIGTSPDNEGNLYITDNEGAANPAGSRIRKVLSGLRFPATAAGSTTTQNVEIHFNPADTPAAANGFTVPAGNTDFKLGSAACTLNADTTTDCVLPVSFKPSVAGYDTATLSVNTTLGARANFLLIGTGVAATVAFDPGNVAAAAATVANPQGVLVDGAGGTYVADTSNNRVLYAPAGGSFTVIAGTGAAAYTGDNGLATAATLRGPKAIALDSKSNVYIADTGNNVIRKIDASGIITTYAGGATSVCNTAFDTFGDGCPGTSATFKAPAGLVADNLGQLFVADSGNNVIRQIANNGWVFSFAGGASANTVCTKAQGATDNFGDGCSASTTTFNNPTALAFDATGQTILVADTGDNLIRKISLNNQINVTGNAATSVLYNPVTAVAGNGQAGSSIDVNTTAVLSQLNSPTGVAVDAAGNIYIADTGNHAVRLVNAGTGSIFTIAGILGASGTGSVPASAVTAQLNSPSGVAVALSGTLTLLDAGNNRVLTDSRTQVSFTFGRTNVPASSPVQNFTELNIGTSTTSLPSPLFTASGDSTQFTLTAAPNASGTVKACSSSLTSGAICNLQGQFSPATTGTFSATYTENGTSSTGATPSIKLSGVGAVLTTTSAVVAQTVPATGDSQFGGSVTLTATITPSSCNTAAPGCVPTGTVSFVVDGTATAPVALDATGKASQPQTGLSVGAHTISCNYSGDGFYAASTCAVQTINVSQASTTATVTAGPNNQVQFPTTSCFIIPKGASYAGDTQCSATTLTATVKSGTSGTPTGSVNFYATGGAFGSSKTLIGSASLDPVTAAGSATLNYVFDSNFNLAANSTLAPGTYSITCTYSGASNFATSTCAPFTLVIAPQSSDFSLVSRGCAASALAIAGTATPGEGVACNPGPENTQSGAPLVTVAQGSTTDATIFINPSNTLSGTLTFSCSGLPSASTCTFSPTSVTVAATSNYAAPIAIDMTLWTDLQPGVGTASLRNSDISLATILGWPVTLLGFAGIVAFRRKASSLRGLSLLVLLVGSATLFTGCAGGPGAYKPNLTPPGTYPIVVTVKSSSGTSHTTTVYWKVTSPGITGQQ